MEYWQIVSNRITGNAVYKYRQDAYDCKIFWYQGHAFEFRGIPVEEMVLKAAIRGNVRFFRLKHHNIMRGVVFRPDMEFMFE